MTPAARSVVDALREVLTDPEAREEVAALLGGAAPRTLHTTATIARELEVSERTVRRAIEAGELAAMRRTGRWVMTVAAVEAWVQSGASPRSPLRAPSVRAARRGSLADIFADA